MKTLRVTSSGNAIAGVIAGSKLRGITLVGGSTDSSAIIYDAATQTGTPLVATKALTNDYKSTMLPGEQGLSFRTGLSVTIAGTGAELYLFLD